MGKIISVANQKGGVGKTTSTINIGTYLAAGGFNTLLCDMDPQSNTTSGLGSDASKGNIYDVIIGAKDIRDIIIRTDIINLSLLPAVLDLAAAELELVPLPGRETLLKERLLNIKGDYDFILIDCPPSLGLLTVNALTASDSVLIPLQCEYYAMEGLGQLMNTIRRIRAGFNKELALEGILFTMYDKRNNLSKEVYRQVTEFLPSEVFKTVIPRNVKLSEAPSYGQPISLYDNTSSGALSYHEAAKELIERNRPKGAEELQVQI